MLAAVMWGAYAAPASALDLNPANYFKLTYEPVTFDKTEIAAGETFHAVFKGKASCTKTLPFSPSQATKIPLLSPFTKGNYTRIYSTGSKGVLKCFLK